MPPNTKNLIGKIFTNVVVLKYSKKQLSKGHSYWKCKCLCGHVWLVRGSHLIERNTKSCGRTNKCKFAYELSETDSKKEKAKKNQTGKTNSAWKGKSAKVAAKHQWLSRNYNKGNKCLHCKTIGKKLDWALLKGKKYEHKRENFIPLCRSCHLKYDYTQERKDKVSFKTKMRHLKNKNEK